MSKRSIRIGIVRLSSFGDIVVSASLLMDFYHALQQHYDEVRIEWFVDTRFAGLLEHHRGITTLHTLPIKSLKSLRTIKNLWRDLRALGEFDMVLDLQGLIKSALVARALESNNIVGFSFTSARESLASLLYNKRVQIAYDSNILARNLAIYTNALQLCGITDENIDSSLDHSSPHPNTTAKQPSSDTISQERGFSWDSKTALALLDPHAQKTLESSNYRILFVLEASIEQKTYPIEQYLKLALLLQNTHASGMTFCLIYHEHRDKALTLRTMLEAQGLNVCIFPPLDFNALKYVLSRMHCVIGGDTGVTHLAWGIGNAKVITLFGNPHTSKGKNMSATQLSRVLLGNPYVLSQSGRFEIASIAPESILDIWQHTQCDQRKLNI